jgi:branched-chain amino acid transport system ATP-binding protein
LHAYHGKSHILQAVDRNGAAEEIVYLLDRNGVGHRPACKAIMALLRPQGSIACPGRQIPYLRADPMAQLRLGHVSEHRQIFPTLTNAEHLPDACGRP